MKKKLTLISIIFLALLNVATIYYAVKINKDYENYSEIIEKAKENHATVIIGNYIVYVDENNKIIDINTFTREVQTWGRKYEGEDLEDIRERINNGEDLKDYKD